MIPTVFIVRFSIAFAASFLFGWARQRLGKPIGFGTFIFLAQGSCALALTARALSPENPLPLLSAIVTGVGFLGAGALIRTGERVVGFTSAATIWAFAILGLCVGVGEYWIAGLLYATVWTVVFVDWRMERHWIGSHQRKFEVEVKLDTTDEELLELGIKPRAEAHTLRYDRELRTMALTFMIRKPSEEVGDLIKRLEASPHVVRLSLES